MNQDDFFSLAGYLGSLLSGNEVMLLQCSGEDSDFVRLNKNRVRQAGHVQQCHADLKLVLGNRQVSISFILGLSPEADRQRAVSALKQLREMLRFIPMDPFLLYSTDVCSTESVAENRLPRTEEMVAEMVASAEDRDLVGILAAGGMFQGFANSFGQRNWFETYTFNADWSLYHRGDKAVKCGYAGFEWDPAVFQGKMSSALEHLAVMERPPVTIEPGAYRVYLAPAAVDEFLKMLGENGFGLKNRETRQSPLIRLQRQEVSLDSRVTVVENTRDGVAPNFQEEGFIKPDKVPLVEFGRIGRSLASPRSAREYGVAQNGADWSESPRSIDMTAGRMPVEEAAQRLGEGVLINNVWYLNYSDLKACRITGLTRFASFWVESGQITAPLSVMRFDESIYRMLGKNLVDLTRERELILSPETYDCRSVASARLPGALVDDFVFTL